MDCIKVGRLIFSMRKELGFTQSELANKLNISDKTVSKWERGLGCPDISLLNELADILGISTEIILSGELSPNEIDGGNMKKVKFYLCPDCTNILASTGNADISCCGRKLTPLSVKKADEVHSISIEDVEDEQFITFSHDMTKQHYICFFAYVTYDKLYMFRMYPEQSPTLRIPKLYGGKMFFCCSEHGLFEFKS